jgi:cation diffusion facilitator CzcD-associated flavoprotein CzcO
MFLEGRPVFPFALERYPVHTVEPDVVTDVLIVGSGPGGAPVALALSTYGVPNIVVTRYASLAGTPRTRRKPCEVSAATSMHPLPGRTRRKAT